MNKSDRWFAGAIVGAFVVIAGVAAYSHAYEYEGFWIAFCVGLAMGAK